MVLALFGMWNHRWTPRALKIPAGVMVAPGEPVQRDIPSSAQRSFRFKGAKLVPLAHFQAQARLISVAWYSDRDSEFSPVDLGISWGKMSDSKNLDALRWKHGTRFLSYYWDQAGPPIPQLELDSSIANIHVITEDARLLKRIEGLAAGSLIRIRGDLVKVQGENYQWQSSLSRTDTGAGACEVLFLRELVLL
jgi:hypothetical protein